MTRDDFQQSSAVTGKSDAKGTQEAGARIVPFKSQPQGPRPPAPHPPMPKGFLAMHVMPVATHIKVLPTLASVAKDVKPAKPESDADDE